MSHKAVPPNKFLSLRVLLTEECNLACVFCHNEGQPGGAAFSELTGAGFATLLRAAGKRGLKQVKFSGGEPTLHPRLPELVRASADAGLDTVVISNGVRTDVLTRAVRTGVRVCLNLPSLDTDAYRRLTRGDFRDVERTLVALVDGDTEVAINSYARLTPDVESLKDLLVFADRHRCGLKLLLPCQTSSLEKQQNAKAAYTRLLAELGCRHELDTPYDSRWRSVAKNVVRVVQPWCPHVCKQVSHFYRSIRLTAGMRLLPCFGGSQQTLPIDLSSEDACGEGLDRALSLTGGACGTATGLKVLRRTTTTDDENRLR